MLDSRTVKSLASKLPMRTKPFVSFRAASALLGFLALSAFVFSADAPLSQPATEAAPQTIAASDTAFLYEGRFDFSDPAAPGVVWQGSRIRFDFDGPTLALKFDGVKGDVFFNAELDGHTTLVELHPNQPAVGANFSHLSATRHHLVLFKRTEATAGSAHFLGAEIAGGAHPFPPTAPAYKLAMQFFGDSITVGACNEDGDTDQWTDHRTHNNALSYGAMTAAAFNADYRNVAVSGIGIAIGWMQHMTFGQIWDRVYPDPDSPRADLTQWTPQIVFTNFGENDDSFTTAKKMPFPDAAYIDGYVAFVHAVRQAYPEAQIVILRGGMFGGAKSDRLRVPWEAAVKTLESTDAHVGHFVFKHWSSNHPRVADHRAMADELIAWLKEQPFIRFDG